MTDLSWRRRRDLEGGKELGVWLLTDGETVEQECYVESHEYRGEGFDLYRYDGDWDHRGSFETAPAAFDAAADLLADSQYPVEGD